MARTLLSPDEAWARIAAAVRPLREQELERRSAAGRILTRALPATLDLPGSDVSAMDGYALSGGLAAEAALPISGTVAAGDPPGLSLAPGGAVRIMTGAPVPIGADRVLEVEATEEHDGHVRRRAGGREPGVGDHIRRRGEIIRTGEMLLPAGSLLTPGALSLLAAHGYATIPVHRSPSVAVLTTGDEVVPPDREPGPGQLRDSHTDFLIAALAGIGTPGNPLGTAPDEISRLRELVRAGLDSDVLLICGGISRGEFDLVGRALTELGCQILFDSVAIQPGQPLTVATHPRGIAFALPGNPASVMAGFWLFARPAIRRMLGVSAGWWDAAFRAELAAPLPAAAARDRFVSASVETRGGVLRVRPHTPRGSHDLSAYALGTALVRVRAGSRAATAGETCEVLPLLGNWSEGV
jgi:molybdopterin molybdotransferase